MRVFPDNARKTRLRRSAERGVALVLVMIFMSLMLLLGLAVTMTGITELGVARNAKLTMEAFNIADAGITVAHELIRNQQGDFSCLIQGADGVPQSGDEFADWPNAPVWDYGNTPPTDSGETVGGTGMWDTTAITPIAGTTSTADGITRTLVRVSPTQFFELIVYDNANDDRSWIDDRQQELDGDPADDPDWDYDQRVLIRSIGYVMATDTEIAAFAPADAIASATVDGIFGLAPYPAVITEGDLELGGNTSVQGNTGSVHTNDDLELTGNSYEVAQSATWSNNDGDGTINPVGPVQNVGNGNGYLGPSDPIYIPNLDPYRYCSDTAVVFVDEGVDQTARDQFFAGGDPTDPYASREENALFLDMNGSGDNDDEIAAAIDLFDDIAGESAGSYGSGHLVIEKLGSPNFGYPGAPASIYPGYVIYRLDTDPVTYPGGASAPAGLGGHGFAPVSSLSVLALAPPTGGTGKGSSNNSGGTNTGSTTTGGTTTGGTTTSGTTTSGTTTSGTTTSGTTTSGTTTSGSSGGGNGGGGGGGTSKFGFRPVPSGGWEDTGSNTDPDERSFFFFVNVADDPDIEVHCNGLDADISIITNGSVFLNGNFNMRGVLKVNPPEDPPWNVVSVMTLAGCDVSINGGADGTFDQQGLIYAHEQFDVRGTGNFVGQLVSFDEAIFGDPKPVDTAGSPVSTCVMSGNFTLTFNAGAGFFGTFTRVSWRQLHDFSPADAR